MNSAKVKKSIENLKKIKGIIEISKFDTLHKLQQAKKITNTYFDMANVAKEMIEFAEKNYKVKSQFPKTFKSGGTLWVYVTIPTSLLATSYIKFDKMILEHYDPEVDSLIAIGKPAVEFAKENKIPTFFESEDLDKEEERVPSMLSVLHMTGEVGRVKFVINSSMIERDPITILPISELNIPYQPLETINKKYKFYPSISNAIEGLASAYVSKLSTALIRESKYFYLKEKLVRHEASLSNVDKRIDMKIREINKLNRKIETEELIHVAQIAKRGRTDE